VYGEPAGPADGGVHPDGLTSWYSVACWRDLADNAAGSLAKGDPVVVYGKQVVRDWETDEGKKGTEVSIDAMSVGHDLRRGQAKFTRIKRSLGTPIEPPSGGDPGLADQSDGTSSVEGGPGMWVEDGVPAPELADALSGR
jgi:single-strand DNA-binding protein